MIRINHAYVVAAALLLAASLSAPLRAEGIRTDELQIPAVISGATFKLEAIVVRPDDGKPHPLALINHGSPRDANDRAKMSPYRMWPQAAAFARRGWTAVAFLRRGYGRSQGAWAETWGSCANPVYERAGRIAAGDIAGVARFMTSQTYVSKADDDRHRGSAHPHAGSPLIVLRDSRAALSRSQGRSKRVWRI